MFRKYEHLERLGHSEVAGILDGEVHVFPKMDGSNGVVFSREWREGEFRRTPMERMAVSCGSRNHELVGDRDNHGFRGWLNSEDEKATALRGLLARGTHPLYVYGEWMVPHNLKTYTEDTWHRFFIFDVYNPVLDGGRFLSWNEYGMFFKALGVDVLEPMAVLRDPNEFDLRLAAKSNTFRIKHGGGVGEGVVLKNYAWRNKYGRQPWAKIVLETFKDAKATVGSEPLCVEEAIAFEFVTDALVSKTRGKIVADMAQEMGLDLSMDPVEGAKHIEEERRGKLIPALLGRVWYEVVTEELWSALKKHGMPTVNFKKLERAVRERTKGLAGDLFA